MKVKYVKEVLQGIEEAVITIDKSYCRLSTVDL